MARHENRSNWFELIGPNSINELDILKLDLPDVEEGFPSLPVHDDSISKELGIFYKFICPLMFLFSHK